jgi:hypothetical protein
VNLHRPFFWLVYSNNLTKLNRPRIRLSTTFLSMAPGSWQTPLLWTTCTWTSWKRTPFLTVKKLWRTIFWKYKQLSAKKTRILTAHNSNSISSILNQWTISRSNLRYRITCTLNSLKFTKPLRKSKKIIWGTDSMKSKFKKIELRSENMCKIQNKLRHPHNKLVKS